MKTPSQQQNATYAIHSNILQKNVNLPVTVAASLDTEIETAPTQNKMKGQLSKQKQPKQKRKQIQVKRKIPSKEGISFSQG